MQMVISSFESVAGLSAATPYISLALKTISKHFTCLKNAITDQVKGITNALGEDLSLPTQKCDNTMSNSSMIKFFDQTFQKQQKGTAPNLGILQEGQHVWRPQRGLPERAVSILRAWLFDHFLHPEIVILCSYPTDTDKHMLASQTGLTRNQVSNWFINARVRVWKPMVEEIHMLETKGGATGTGLDISKFDGKPTTECAVDYQEKRSRIEYHVPSSVEGSLMGGLGAVSLTLGLRQSAEGGATQRPQLLQQEHHHMRRQHLGGCWLAD
ncbi:hypothetical protein RD792_009808 [Penstemon davidsonii]|uniref:Homeobox domain-containing protein n=1 Tax=Penstemon davidsonii TaxID=160366 RepID=A0ABR0D037_9LAMI|nr:hypothetical protein RD792_009808 [Penstemon davidsonii]